MHKLRKLSIPYLVWMLVLIIIPSIFILMATISTYHAYNTYEFRFTLEFFDFLRRDIFFKAFLNSVKFAGWTTAVCLLLGYPVAYFFAKMNTSSKTLFVALLIVPVWSNMIVRIKAWESIFKPVSILNIFGLSFNIIGSDAAIIIAMVSMYLPFMVFPIYAVLQKMDEGLIEASQDLGANRLQTFLRVTLPLSMSGIVSGIIMTMLPSMTAFALPERLSNGKIVLLGNLIENQLFKGGSFNIAATVALVVMVIVLGLFALIVRFDKEGETLL